jgi:hypothetical protein
MHGATIKKRLICICVKQMEKRHCLWLVVLLSERLYQRSLVLCRLRVKTMDEIYKYFGVSSFKSNVSQCADSLFC